MEWERRFTCLCLFGLVFLDIFTLIPIALILITGYRIPKFFTYVRDKNWGFVDTNGEVDEPKAIWRTWYQGCKVVRDFPFMLMAIIVTCCPWRAPFMWVDLSKTSGSWKKAQVIGKHFALIFLDILDLPFVIASFLIMLTVWRSFALVKELKEAWKNGRNAMRLASLQQFGLWLWDIPSAFVFIILMITVYRAKDTIQELNQLRKKYFIGSGSQVPATVPTIEEEENPTPTNLMISWSWHTIVFRQFGLLLLDLPLALISILTLWRLPLLIKNLTECETALERRVMVLSVLFKTGKDIVVAIIFLLLCLSWRIVSIVKLFQTYKQGDDEHKAIFFIFLEYLKDMPFFVLFLINLPFLWRSGPLILYLIFLPDAQDKDDEEQVNVRRIAIAVTSIIILLDIIFTPLTILAACFVWRIPTIIELITTKKPIDNPYAKSVIWYESIGQTLIIEMADILSIVQIVFIIGGIFHLPSYVLRCFNLSKNWKKDPSLFANDTHNTDIEDAIAQNNREGVKWPSFTLFRVITNNEFLGSLREMPHIILLPLKLIGVIFLPLHLFLRWQIERKGSLTLSILRYPLLWIHELSEERFSFWGFHQFAILNLIGSCVIIPNYIALIPMSVNSVLIFICTFGDPVWKSIRETFGYMGLGTGEGCCGFLDTVLLVSNLIWIPILLFVQFVMLFFPIWIFVILTLPFTSAEDYFYVFFIDPSVYWAAVGQMPGWVWIVFFFWIETMIAAEHLTILHIGKYYALFNPLTAIMWVVQKVFAGKVWGLYRALLGVPAQWAYVHKDTCGCLGEFIIAPIILIWSLWPAIIPCVVQIYIHPNGWYFWFLSGPMIAFFCWHGIFKKPLSVIRLNWRKHTVIQTSPYPKVEVDFITATFPPGGGFEIRIKGKKPTDLKVEQALLFLEGDRSSGADQFWAALNSIFGSKTLSMGKMTMYPVKLVPNHINKSSFSNPTPHTEFTIHIPAVMNVVGQSITIKKELLTKNFQKIVEAGDPEVEFIVEFTSRPIKEGPYKKHGYIVKFKTKFSAILSADTIGSLDCTVMDGAGNWAPPTNAVYTPPEIIPFNNDIPKEVTPLILKSDDIMQELKLESESSSSSGKGKLLKKSKSEKSKSEKSEKLKKSGKLKKSEKSEPFETDALQPPITDDAANTDDDVDEIVSMGFSRENVMVALSANSGNKEAAINSLLSE